MRCKGRIMEKIMQIENNKEEVPFSFYEEKFRELDPEDAVARLGDIWDGKEFYVNLLGKTYAIAHPVYGIREVSGETDSSRSFGMTRGRETDSSHSLGMTGEERIPRRDAPRNDRFFYSSSVTGRGKERNTICAAVGANCFPALPGASLSAGTCPLPVQTFLLRYLLEGKQVQWKGTWKTFREMPWGELYIKPYTGRVLTRAAFTFGTRIGAFKAACEKMGAQKVNHGDAGYEFTLIGGYAMQIIVWEGDEEFPPNAQVLYSDNFEQGFAPEDRVVAGDILITAIKGNM